MDSFYCPSTIHPTLKHLKRLALTIIPLVSCWLYSAGQNTESANESIEDSLIVAGHYLHYSGSHGKWRISGREIRSPDSTIEFTSAYHRMDGDSSRFYSEEKWFYENGMLKQLVIVNFRKRKKAVVLEKQYNSFGKLTSKKKRKTRRQLGQIRIPKAAWTWSR